MKRVKVEICCGTACYLLGSAKLVTIEESLPENLRNLVDVEARTCLDLCERDNLGGAPYVRFNSSEVMAQATPERVLKRIAELAEGAV